MTVDELLVAVNAKIDEAGIRVPDGSRAARYVDLRSFRFYRSQGLVDPPNEMRGVAGVYGERHVLQLVAIKTLQSRFIPLPEIRKRLAEASDEALQTIVTGDAGATVSRTKPVRSRATNRPSAWVQFPAGSMAYVMVAQEFMQTATPSSLRALGQSLTTQLLAGRG